VSVSGSDIEEGVQLVLRLTNGPTTAELGSVDVRLDGTFATSVVVPASFPIGYAELTATSPGETIWTTLVLIGKRAEGPGQQAGAQLDEHLIWLAVLAVGLGIVALATLRYLRSGLKHRGTE
jgi:hypothetical protein